MNECTDNMGSVLILKVFKNRIQLLIKEICLDSRFANICNTNSIKGLQFYYRYFTVDFATLPKLQ